MPPEPRPFPHEAVRDLIAIARAIYAVEQSAPRREELAEIGKALRSAADLARRAPVESLGAKAAWKRADEATARLCALVEGDVLKLVHATAGRVRRG
ncbi:MAG TPA: hypothetical protein VHC69_12790 [Polyangiaceae bacterium]|nr:hypothetical protein [Polyangiaceae bacterium]